MRRVRLQPLTPETFAPFGDIIAAPAEPGRRYFGPLLQNQRPKAQLDLSLVHAPSVDLPFELKLLERHPLSSQAFLPLSAERYLVVVAPAGPRPDPAQVVAFEGVQTQGFVYAPGTWHHPMVTLGAAGTFTLLVWCDGGPQDEEFVDIAEPTFITI